MTLILEHPYHSKMIREPSSVRTDLLWDTCNHKHKYFSQVERSFTVLFSSGLFICWLTF